MSSDFFVTYLPDHSEFVGTRGAEYLDFIAEHEGLESTITSCLTHLEREAHWSILDLQETREESAILAYPGRACGVKTGQWAMSSCGTCFRIPLPVTWDLYRASLGASTRKDVNYDEGRLRKRFAVEFRVIGNQDSEFSGAIESLQRLHQARRAQLGDVGMFEHARTAQMNAALLKACGERRWTKLFLLSLDGEVVAGFSGFEFRDQLFGETFSISPDERWLKLSVGNVLLGLIVRWGIERGLAVIDLTRGNEPYKQRFGGVPAPNYRAVIFASSSAAFVSGMIDRARLVLHRFPWLKRLYVAFRRS